MLATFVVPALGCAARSSFTYDGTVSRIRGLCHSHDAAAQDGSGVDRPVFQITEEGGPDGNNWVISFVEGDPARKPDLAFPRRTEISITREAGDRADYTVRCYDAGPKTQSRNRQREDYWRARVEEHLNR
jgi:hypothetical protein